MNPGCGDPCQRQNVTTLYLMANGPSNDTLHYLWDFMDKPSVLIALSPTTTTLHINWNDYLAGRPGSVLFTGEVTYTFGVIINKVILSPERSLCSAATVSSSSIYYSTV